jgi:hypothetical protein
LHITADRLESGVHYEWGHMGRCNCGHLVQTITGMSADEIVASTAFQLDEWSEHAQDYCAGTGYKVDHLFLTLQEMGFNSQDVIYLENLSDPRVLAHMGERTYLRRNLRGDAVCYLRSMAAMLNEEWQDSQQ